MYEVDLENETDSLNNSLESIEYLKRDAGCANDSMGLLGHTFRDEKLFIHTLFVHILLLDDPEPHGWYITYGQEILNPYVKSV